MGNTRIKSLARLREFRQGMDVEEYLANELRQNWQELTASLAAKNAKARYISSAGNSIPNATVTLFIAGTEIFDTNDSYNATTGKYTCKFNGYLGVSAAVEFTGLTVNTGEIIVMVYKNATEYARLCRPAIGNASICGDGGYALVDVLKDDVIDVRVYQSNGATRTLSTNTVSNWVTFAQED